MLLKSNAFRNFQNAALYLAGSLIQSVIALVTQPIYSKYLKATDFGIIGYFEAIRGFLTPIFILSMTSIYLMKYYKQDEVNNKKLLFNISYYLCIVNTISIFLCYIGLYIYFNLLSITIPLNPFAWYVLISLLLSNFSTLVFINFRVRKKAMSFFLYSLIFYILNAMIGVLFVAIYKWGAEGRMLAPIVASILVLPYSIYILKKYTIANYNFKQFKQNLRIAFPLILTVYTMVPINFIDKIYLERLNNLSEFGLYNLGLTIAGYVNLGAIALGMAFEPDIYKSVAEKNFKNWLKNSLLIILPFIGFVLLYYLVSDKIIYFLTAGKYLAAGNYTNIVLWLYVFTIVLMVGQKTFQAMNKTKIMLYVSLVGSIISLPLMYFCILKWAFLGAAYCKVGIAIIMCIIVFLMFLKQRHYWVMNKSNE